MPNFELFDTVVLKTNTEFVGIIERTHYEGHDDSLHDCLIIAHVPVNDTALQYFVSSGVPPRNHVFIRFANQAHGSSLAHEDDIELLDRTFTLGDVVRRDGDHMLGTVVNLDESFTLRPVWRRIPYISAQGQNVITADEAAAKSSHVWTPDCPVHLPSQITYPHPCELVANVPGRELRKSEDVIEGDYVVFEDWLGVVDDLYFAVTLMLHDGSFVIVENHQELYVPVLDYGKPLVSLPEFQYDIKKPDIVVAQAGWSATVPLGEDDIETGLFVITNRNNTRSGRWLKGRYNDDVRPEGTIVDVRVTSAGVRWLAFNAFIPCDQVYPRPPEEQVELYENFDIFSHRSELRRNRGLTILDQGRFPQDVRDRRRNKTNEQDRTPNVMAESGIHVGQHVKFRDQAGAAVKYQGMMFDGVHHARFERIPPGETAGFDMNGLKVISSHQKVAVLWQDGTMTTHPSRTLTRFPLIETDLAPSDIVVAREGMQQLPASSTNGQWSSFNEMTFFEQPYNLQPSKVGIVQSVDAVERLARIRWFCNPRIRISGFGNILDGDSRFGELSEVIEDVSLFEVMNFPALMRRVNDMVIVVPESPSKLSMKNITHSILPSHTAGVAAISSIQPDHQLGWLQRAARAVTKDQHVNYDTTRRIWPSPDWIGFIVRLGLDGTVTVRVTTGEHYRDVLIEHDQVLCLVDENAISNSGYGHQDFMDVDSDTSDEMMDDSDVASTISETVSYEGGRRLDDDSDNENWEDDEDEASSMHLSSTHSDGVGSQSMEVASSDHQDMQLAATDSDMAMTLSGSGIKPRYDARGDEYLPTSTMDGIASLRAALPEERPPAFEVLERDPPSDQFRAYDNPPASSTLLKRIVKEHRALAAALPANEIYVRTYESRLDLLRCLIVGPADTPYEHAPFLIDLYLGPNFPRDPPTAHFHSWTSGLGRVNPNLYEEGKICLSLLGTWAGKTEAEGWSEKATILQLLVSLQGLVFVSQPFYNEAGFEDYVEDNSYKIESQRYTEKAFVMARGFVKHALSQPVAGLEDVLSWTYLPRKGSEGLLKTVIERGRCLIEVSEDSTRSAKGKLVDGAGLTGNPTKEFLKPLSRGAVVMLRKTIKALEEMLQGDDSNVAKTEPET